MKGLIKSLLCKHSWEKIAWHEEYDKDSNERYTIRWYMCSKCHKGVCVDSRHDKYSKR